MGTEKYPDPPLGLGLKCHDRPPPTAQITPQGPQGCELLEILRNVWEYRQGRIIASKIYKSVQNKRNLTSVVVFCRPRGFSDLKVFAFAVYCT